MFLAVCCLLVVTLPSVASAQTSCGPDVKQAIANALANAEGPEKAALEAELYQKYQHCGTGTVSQNFYIAARECSARVSILGNLSWEDMPCCGYDPQRRQFACPVRIKRTTGYGVPPIPGSRQHVLNCVRDRSGVFVPVGRDSVHMADEMWGNSPTWQFAVIAAANDNLHTVQPMDGQTRQARSILSWELTPTDCEYKPIWGNAIDYNIRLDQ
jgi:hypothetical protein